MCNSDRSFLKHLKNVGIFPTDLSALMFFGNSDTIK